MKYVYVENMPIIIRALIIFYKHNLKYIYIINLEVYTPYFQIIE